MPSISSKDVAVFTQGALEHLQGQQATNGGFWAYASFSQAPFKSHTTLPVTFATSLILSCLSGIQGAGDIRRQAGQFLLINQDKDGSWNYWIKGHPMRRTSPYPNDLDDTACALAALTHTKPDRVTGRLLAKLAQLLVACESEVGGPYRTWLIDPAKAPAWADIDVVVNANIGRLLALHHVSVPGLEAFIDQKLQEGSLTSPYYVGEIPAIYFLSSWYTGEQLELLKQKVQHYLTVPPDNPLLLSMLISAGCRLSVSSSLLAPLVERLLALRYDKAWPAAALYIHSTAPLKTLYAGSSALTTAFALEALHLYRAADGKPAGRKKAPPRLKHSPPEQLKKELSYTASIPDSTLRSTLRTHIKKTFAHDHDQQITGIATITANAYGVKLAAETETHLNRASMYGWIAYTIYDDFLDAEGQPTQLGAAHVAQRWSIDCFYQALPISAEFQVIVRKAFMSMDIANDWEATYARAKYDSKKITIIQLPVYKNYLQLAERSWGHVLASYGVIYGSCGENARAEARRFQRFFRHYLIARQLNDDAHDWEDDLRQGRLTVVVTLLLTQAGRTLGTLTSKDVDALKFTYWQVVIVEVAELIKHHTQLAGNALRQCAMDDSRVFEQWIRRLDNAATQTLTRHAQATEFIETYDPK